MVHVSAHGQRPIQVSVQPRQSAASVSTEKPVYSVGETVTIYVYVSQPGCPIGCGGSWRLVISKPDGSQFVLFVHNIGQSVQTITADEIGTYRISMQESPVLPTPQWGEAASTTFQVIGSQLQVSVSANPTSGSSPLTVSFSTQVSGGVSPYSYNWNFGDGSSSGGQNPTHTYANSGTYTATLTVTDNSGSQRSASVIITVTAPVQPLSVSISANPTQGEAPLTVSFTSQVTGGSPGYTYDWNFGDGGTDTSPNPTHVYSQPGDYAVTLTVSDSSGNSATSSPLTITLVAPTTTTETSSSATTSSIASTGTQSNGWIDTWLTLSLDPSLIASGETRDITVSGELRITSFWNTNIGICPGSVVQLFFDGQLIGQGTTVCFEWHTGGYFETKYTVPPLDAGAHTIEAYFAGDNTFRSSQAYASLTISPAASSYSIHVTVQPAGAVTGNVIVYLYDNQGNLIDEQMQDSATAAVSGEGTGPYNFEFTVTTPGQYTLKASVIFDIPMPPAETVNWPGCAKSAVSISQSSTEVLLVPHAYLFVGC